MLQAADLKIWKAFNVTDLSEFDRYNKRKEICGFVLDAAAPGSGQVFEWDLLKKLPETDKMKLLAGGLDPENVEQALMLKVLMVWIPVPVLRKRMERVKTERK